MDYYKAQKKIYQKGYGKAAKRLGTSFEVYRSTDGIDPISEDNLVGTYLMSANVSWSYEKGNKYGNNVWQLCVDGTDLKVGDYLVEKSPQPENHLLSTFFIIGMQPLLPILGVKCDRVVTVTEPKMDSGHGAVGYGGYTKDETTTIVKNCPCSFIYANRGELIKSNLPTTIKLSWFYVYLPFISGFIKTGHIITDDSNISYEVGGDEKTELGWRLYVSERGS